MKKKTRKSHTTPIRAARQIGCRFPALTIIELAVSIVTLAIAASVVLSAVGDLRRSSKELRCLHNLGRIATATSAYSAADANEQSIPVHSEFETEGRGPFGEVEWGGKSGDFEYQSPIDSHIPRWGTAAGRGPSTRPLNRIIYKRSFPDNQDDAGPNNENWILDSQLELDVFHCPADYGYTGRHYSLFEILGQTSYDQYGNSYAANQLWVAVFDQNDLLYTSGSPFLKPVSGIPSPSRTLLFQENALLFGWVPFPYTESPGLERSSVTAGDHNDDPHIAGWHGAPFSGNATFADGHSARIKMDGHILPHPDIETYPAIAPWYEQTANPRHALIRGADWQKDTLPSPLTSTSSEFRVNGIRPPVVIPYF